MERAISVVILLIGCPVITMWARTYCPVQHVINSASNSPEQVEKSVFYFASDGKSYLNSYSAYPPPSDNDVDSHILPSNMLLTRHQTPRSKLDNHFLILHEMEKAISTVILRIRHLVIMMLQVNMLVTRYQTEIAPLPSAVDSVHST
jgi:hypothetical protein